MTVGDLMDKMVAERVEEETQQLSMLLDTKQELIATMKDLVATKEELIATKKELIAVQKEKDEEISRLKQRIEELENK